MILLSMSIHHWPNISLPGCMNVIGVLRINYRLKAISANDLIIKSGFSSGCCPSRNTDLQDIILSRLAFRSCRRREETRQLRLTETLWDDSFNDKRKYDNSLCRKGYVCVGFLVGLLPASTLRPTGYDI